MPVLTTTAMTFRMTVAFNFMLASPPLSKRQVCPASLQQFSLAPLARGCHTRNLSWGPGVCPNQCKQKTA